MWLIAQPFPPAQARAFDFLQPYFTTPRCLAKEECRSMDFGTIVGLIAAGCTTFPSVPQLKKCWETGSAGDLSLRMVLIHQSLR
jgi:hypothetical protein